MSDLEDLRKQAATAQRALAEAAGVELARVLRAVDPRATHISVEVDIDSDHLRPYAVWAGRQTLFDVADLDTRDDAPAEWDEVTDLVNEWADWADGSTAGRLLRLPGNAEPVVYPVALTVTAASIQVPTTADSLDDVLVVEADPDLNVLGLQAVTDDNGRPHLVMGHWPDGEEWVEVARVPIPPLPRKV